MRVPDGEYVRGSMRRYDDGYGELRGLQRGVPGWDLVQRGGVPVPGRGDGVRRGVHGYGLGYDELRGVREGVRGPSNGVLRGDLHLPWRWGGVLGGVRGYDYRRE
jgi:hypothetical protein